MVRIALALSILVAACGDDTTGGEGFSSIEYVEVPLDVSMGVQRTTAWEISISDFCVKVLPDDHYLLPFAKMNRVSGDPVWTAQLPEHAEVQCPVGMHPTPDGGAIFVSNVAGDADTGRTIATRVDGTGTIVWEHAIPGRSHTTAAGPVSLLLASGELVVSFPFQPPPGSIADPTQFLIVLDTNGNEARRTEIPRILVESADVIGTPNNEFTPGTGIPNVLTLVERDDGSIVLSGRYEFSRAIECGSQGDPRTPTTASCGDGAMDGYVALVEPDGTYAWERRLGSAYLGGWIQLFHTAVFADGSILAAGHMFTDRHGASTPHAIAARYAADGELLWAHAIPFGKLATATPSAFHAIFGGSAGTIDLMFVPASNPCRLIRMEPDGTVSRVQILQPEASTTAPNPNFCLPAQAVGDGVAFTPVAPDLRLMMLAP